MSSSYISESLDSFNKADHISAARAPHPTLPKNTTALITHVCDSHSASQENETASKGEEA